MQDWKSLRSSIVCIYIFDSPRARWRRFQHRNRLAQLELTSGIITRTTAKKKPIQVTTNAPVPSQRPFIRRHNGFPFRIPRHRRAGHLHTSSLPHAVRHSPARCPSPVRLDLPLQFLPDSNHRRRFGHRSSQEPEQRQ